MEKSPIYVAVFVTPFHCDRTVYKEWDFKAEAVK